MIWHRCPLLLRHVQAVCFDDQSGLYATASSRLSQVLGVPRVMPVFVQTSCLTKLL